MFNDIIMESIERTKQGFEESFKSGDFYNKQTQDGIHLQKIMNFLDITDGMKVLDLGTGTGYLSFPLAEKYPDVQVTGMDIVEQALCENRKRAQAVKLMNLSFVSYDGIDFPFEDDSYDMVITRYALHHFPVIDHTFKEIYRILKKGGTLFLSDPAPNDNDMERFVDAYMQMKKDGHIRFYTQKEWQIIGKKAGLTYIDGFETSIRFPKKIHTAPEFNNLVKRFTDEVLEGYHLEIIGDEIWITEKVNNMLFEKMSNA